MANFRLFNMDAVYARKNLKKIAWVPIRGIVPMPKVQWWLKKIERSGAKV